MRRALLTLFWELGYDCKHMYSLKKIEEWLPLKPATRGTLLLRTYGWTQWPLLALTKPKVVELNEHACRILMPFRKLIKNHHGSVYFGALAMGADACVGVLAFEKIRKSGHTISFIFKSFEAEFLQRAEGAVVFICNSGEKIDELIESAVTTQERVNAKIPAMACVDGEEVCRFQLELSIKVK